MSTIQIPFITGLRKAFGWKWTQQSNVVFHFILQNLTVLRAFLFSTWGEYKTVWITIVSLSWEENLLQVWNFVAVKNLSAFSRTGILPKEAISIFQPLALQFNPAIISADIRSEEKIHNSTIGWSESSVKLSACCYGLAYKVYLTIN